MYLRKKREIPTICEPLAWNIPSDAHHFGWDSANVSTHSSREQKVMPESHIVPRRTKSNNGCDITALKTTKTAKAWWVREDTIGLLSTSPWLWFKKQRVFFFFFFLSRPCGKPPLLEVKHTRGSIIKHGKRKLLSNVIHDKWKKQFNSNMQDWGRWWTDIKSFFGLICTSANASKTINQNNLQPNFIIHCSFAPPTTYTGSEKLG